MPLKVYIKFKITNSTTPDTPKIDAIAVVKKLMLTPNIIFDKIKDIIPKNIFLKVFLYG